MATSTPRLRFYLQHHVRVLDVELNELRSHRAKSGREFLLITPDDVSSKSDMKEK